MKHTAAAIGIGLAFLAFLICMIVFFPGPSVVTKAIAAPPPRTAHYAGRSTEHLRSALQHYGEACFRVAAYQWVCPLPSP